MERSIRSRNDLALAGGAWEEILSRDEVRIAPRSLGDMRGGKQVELQLACVGVFSGG